MSIPNYVDVKTCKTHVSIKKKAGVHERFGGPFFVLSVQSGCAVITNYL